jgi:TnpA family transposase
MRFTAPASAIHAGPNPKYFGQSRGVTWYNLMSNQFSGLNGIVVPGTLRDSPCCWHFSSNRKPSWSLPNS